jgi:hypothetical protein
MCYENEIENRRKKEEYLSDWVQKFNQASEFIPKIEQLRDITRWEIDALSNAPEEAEEVPTGDMLETFNTDFGLLTLALPPLPEISKEFFSSTDGSTTASSSVVFVHVTRVGDIPNENAKAYSEQYSSRYQELQNKYNFPEEIRFLLNKMGFPNTLSRFNSAEKFYFLYKGENKAKTAAAMEMRTFLDGLKGDLFNLARLNTSENMTWDKMALRLTGGDKSSQEFSLLLRQGKDQSSLTNRLSSIGKNREGQSVTNLHYIRNELLSHVYTILKIIIKG